VSALIFLCLNEIAPGCPDGGAEKRVSERKLRLQEAPEARKPLFRAADQPQGLWICLKKICFFKWQHLKTDF
jgi:hypothetical protein